MSTRSTLFTNANSEYDGKSYNYTDYNSYQHSNTNQYANEHTDANANYNTINKSNTTFGILGWFGSNSE